MTTTVPGRVPQKIHPHKFIMWVAIGGIVMMFAGLTSAYIVKKNQSSWLQFDLPIEFFYSTAVIVLSSITMFLSVRAIRAGKMNQYKTMITVTAVLGFAFLLLQYLGFKDLQAKNIAMVGARSNSAASFLFVITFLHMIHVLGGVTALIVFWVKAKSKKITENSVVSVEILGTYWHFVDLLWIYLFLFYNWIG
ncbi:MAG: cytochrome c oxidase subunit 3 [Bacteroidetes bacterium]|nr:cytochrome c oxidase subunit 3 [Bacteroidota bacterium]